MKHNFKYFACLFVAILCFGQVWGAVYFEDTFSNVGSASSGSVLPRDGWTAGSGTAAPQGNSGVRLGASSSGASIVKSAMTSIEGTKSLKVTIYVARYNTNANTLTVTTTNGTISALADGSVGTLSDGTLTISPSANAGVTSTTAAATWTDDFKTEFTISGASSTTTITFSSNKRVILGPVKIEDADGTPAPAKTLTGVTVSGTPTKTSYYAGDNFDPAGLTVTGTYSDASTAPITSGITWSYDPSQELALNQTSIGVIATVSEIASPKFIVSGLTVTAAPAAVNYEKVTSALTDWSGEFLLVYESGTTAYVWTGADAANCYVSATISNDVIAKPEGAATLTIAAMTGGYSLLISGNNNNGKYITDNANNAALKFADAAYAATISYETDWTKILFSQRCIRYNSSSGQDRFRYYAATSQQPVQLYKKVEGSVKPAAGLAYAEADQKKLVKLGDSFTAPTLTNPNHLTVSYASNAESVAEVNVSTGAVTIKAAGVAVITASFAGNDDYKEGSASYTICVVTHAGTEADPFDVADARNVIDALGTKEGVYMSGKVSQITTAYDETYHNISFDISTDGTTAADQVRAFRCKGLGNTDFTSEDDVKTGATVTVYGNLTKYNSTYEFEAGCYLTAYEAPEVPKTHIANTKETAYTVAQALAYAADGVTYDLDDYVYVQGVVYDVKNFNSTNGTLDIYIKDANAENQFELFKCAGINNGSSTTPFEALTDVQAGNIVIGYGQMMYFKDGDIYEFKAGNYIVDLQVPVTGVELDATASVEVDKTVNLTATILPSNATGTIVWSVTSGSEYASVAEGVVTGVAEGSATIRATVQGTEIYAECTVIVTAASAPVTYDYALVTAASQLQDGLKVIIVAAEEDKAAGSAAATYRNVVDVERTSDGNYLILDSENMPTEFTLGVPAAGQYTFNDGDGYMYESAAKSVKVQADPFSWSITIGEGNIAAIQATNELRYNSSSPRFTTYASGQQALQLYVKDDGKQAAGLAWSTDAVELTVGDAFTAPTLTNPNNLTVTIASNNLELATVEGGVVSLVENATGTATITASYAGDDTYRAASVSYTITVSATTPAPAGAENVVIIAEYNSKFYALTNSINNKTAAAVVVEKDGDNIIVPSADAKTAIQWTKTTSGENTTFQDADGKYLKGVSNGGDLTVVDDACNWSYNSTDKYYYIGSRSFIYRESANGFKNYATSNAGSSDYSAIAEVRVIDAENIVVTSKADPQLAYNPTSVELTVGGTFTPATLTYASGFDGLAAVTYESSNTDLATVEGGVVSLVADATGTATITASFAGNTNYLSGSASYTIKVNEVQEDLPDAWVLVTDISQIESGMSVIIASEIVDDNIYTMGAQNNNNRAGVQSSIENGVLTPGDGTEIFKLVDAGDDCFAIQASNNNYLYAVSNSSNYLKEETKLDANRNYAWSISIKDGKTVVLAQGDKTRNLMRFNPNSGSPIFSCYASTSETGTAVALYIPKVEEEPDPQPQDPDYTPVRSGLEPGRFYTICMGTEILDIRGASFWRISQRDQSGSVAYLEEESAPYAAGKPFLFFATAATLEVAYGTETANVAGTNGALHGTLSDMTADDLDDLADAGLDIYMMYQNAFHPLGTNNHLDANRAYLVYGDLQPVSTEPQSTPGRQVRKMPLQGNVATGIEEGTNADNTIARKVMIDGQLFILRGEKMYDATGAFVK